MPSSEDSAVGELRVGDLLSASTLPTLEARALLAHQLGVARERLIMRPDQCVASEDMRGFAQLVERRERGEPLAYLLGEKEFYGRMFAVSPAVLIPRPETELLVEIVLALGLPDEAHIVDLGTGSGCIAITPRSSARHGESLRAICRSGRSASRAGTRKNGRRTT
jgi:release factor glutamine methyltransferase